MAPRFLAIGECMVELAAQGEGLYRRGFAGDTFNTAWYASRLAGPSLDVGYLSAVGDDVASGDMVAFMQAAGIRPVLRVIPGRSVGLYMISLDRGERSFSYWRDTSAARDLADDLGALAQLSRADMAYFSGITLAILARKGREDLLSALADARGRGVTVAFDPNLRPRLWPDLASMRDWITEGARVADITLPSFEDEQTHFGDADPQATLGRYGALGPMLCVVKNGPGPVFAQQSDQRIKVAPDAVPEIVDTTAAGDSFNAAFLVSHLGGAPLETSVRAGCALSARVIARPGALVELSDPLS